MSIFTTMEALLSLVILSIISTVVYYVLQKKPRHSEIYKLPHPPSLPFVGSALQLAKDEVTMTRKLLIEWPKKYGPRSTFRILGREYFTSTKTSDIETLLSSTTQLKKGGEYEFVNTWLGNGILTTSQVPKWSKHRKMLNPSFSHSNLEQFNPVFNKHAKVLVEILEKDCGNGQKELNICHYSNYCALDILCETSMGKSLNSQRERDSEYVNAIYEISRLILWRFVRPWLYPSILWKLSPSGRREKVCLKILHGFTDKVLKERKVEVLKLREKEKLSRHETLDEDSVFMNKKKRPLALMDLLLIMQADNTGSLSDENIRAETDTFMFAGHDTGAANLVWTVYLLGLYPKIQERLFRELIDTLGDNLANEVTSKHLVQLKYLECCIKEALRMYPSVATTARELVEDLTLDGGLVVPKGFNFILVPFAIHRDPHSFPNPDVYKPERFSPENSVGRHPYSYIPFSMGPRNCIGQKFALMEQKVILAHLLRKFRIESVTQENTITLVHEIILRPKDGLIVKLYPRS